MSGILLAKAKVFNKAFRIEMNCLLKISKFNKRSRLLQILLTE